MPQSANCSEAPRAATDASSTCASVRTGWADACLAVGKTGRWIVPTRVGCRSAREAPAPPAHSRHGFSAEGTRAEAPCPPRDPQSTPPPRAATRLCMAPAPAISKPMPPARRRLPGCAPASRFNHLALSAKCRRVSHRQRTSVFQGCRITRERSDRKKCSLKGEQMTKSKFSLLTYRNT